LFATLEVVRSATPVLRATFITAIGPTNDDPEDRLASIEDQTVWIRGRRLDRGRPCLARARLRVMRGRPGGWRHFDGVLRLLPDSRRHATQR
jgi:hypothetical protein